MSLHIDCYPASGATTLAPIVLLHGWGVSGNSWQPLIPELQKVADVWVVDLPGFGASHMLPTFTSQAVLTLLFEQLPPVMHLVGWSLGGMLAVEFTQKYPARVKKLVTLGSNACFVEKAEWPEAMPKQVNAAFNSEFKKNPQLTLKRFYGLLTQGSMHERELLKTLRKKCLPNANEINDNWYQALQYLSKCNNIANLRSISVPGLHLLAKNDALVPALAAVNLQSLNTKQLVDIVPNACHALHWDCSSLVLEKITYFLQAKTCVKLRTKKSVARSFSRAATSYDSVAHLQRKVGDALLTQVPCDQSVVLDLGVGTGFLLSDLKKRTNASQLVALDLAEGMLHVAREKHNTAAAWVCGDAESLPFSDRSYNLIFSNLALQWCEDLPQLFSELYRILEPGGTLIFSTLSKGTLSELGNAWKQVNGFRHVNHFNNKSTIQESLLAEGFTCERPQQETHTLHYQTFSELAHELKALGAHNVNQGRPTGLTSRSQLAQLVRAYEAYRTLEGLPLTYEVLYMQATRAAL